MLRSSPGRDHASAVLGLTLRPGDGSALGFLGDELVSAYVGPRLEGPNGPPRKTGRVRPVDGWMAAPGTRFYELDGTRAGIVPGADPWDAVVVLVSQRIPEDEELAAVAAAVLLSGAVVLRGPS